MPKDMLGSVIRAAVGVPQSRLDLLAKVASKFAGDNTEGDAWYRHLNTTVNNGLPDAPPVEVPKILELVTTDTLDAIERFVAKEKFREGRKTPDGVKLAWLGSNLTANFLGKVEENVPATELKLYSLRQSSRDIPIITELGGEDIVETKLAQLWEMLKRQGRGETGKLLVNGYANIFYVRDVNGVLWAVGARWGSVVGGWDVGARSLGDPDGWDAGGQVVSR